jgi:regulatory protein YycH of two-component signal transduction system YycFG
MENGAIRNGTKIITTNAVNQRVEYQARSAEQRPTKPWISSEAYRQLLVKDGERRFAEWHGEFLDYQRQFLASQST